MRKVALYALIMLGLIGTIALLPGQSSVRAYLLKRAITALPPSTTITYDSAHGNLWTGVKLRGVTITDEHLGTLSAAELHVSYYLPAVLGGELPLSVHATNVHGDVSVSGGLPQLAQSGPSIAVLLQDIDIDGFDLHVNGVPFALAALELRDLHITQPNARTLALAGEISSEFGAINATANLDVPSGVLTGDIVHADLGFVRTWWPLLTAGSGRGSFQVDGSDITASLFVTGAELDIVDLGLHNVAGVVTFDYPVLEFDVETQVLGGSANVVGTVDFAQSYFHVEGPATAPLRNLADWIARNSLPDGIPVDITGTAQVEVVVDGWHTVQVDATGNAAGSALGFPLEANDVAYTYYHNGRMRLDTNAFFTGEPITATIRPHVNDSTLTIDAPVLSLFTDRDASLQLQSQLHAGEIQASGAVSVPTFGDTLHLHVDFDAVPGAYSLFTEGTLQSERVVTGAFAIDGLGSVAGQIGLRLPLFPGQAPVVATGGVHGDVSRATVTLETESPDRLLVPLFGTEIDTLDLRGHLQAEVDVTGFRDIHGQIGGLRVQHGEYSFTEGGSFTVAGTAHPSIAGVTLPLTVHEFIVNVAGELAFTGSLGIDVPELPSVREVHISSTNGELTVHTGDGALTATYGPRGLLIGGTNVPVTIAGTELAATVSVRERAEGYFTEVTLPAGTAYGGITLRNQLHATGSIDPAQPTHVLLNGSTGGVPLRLGWENGEATIALVQEDPFTVTVAGTKITAAGTTNVNVFDALFCLGDCSSELGLAGAIETNLTIDAEQWTYSGNARFTPTGLPVVLTAAATESGGLDLLISSELIPSLAIRSTVPAGTPPADVLNEALDALTLDAFGVISGSGTHSGNTIGLHGAVAATQLAGIRVPAITWGVDWNLAENTGTVHVPGGELRVAVTADGFAVEGSAELALEAGGIPFALRITVPPSVVPTLADLPLNVHVLAANNTELVTLSGTAEFLTGSVAMHVDELAALAGLSVLYGTTVDGAGLITGNIAVQPIDQALSASVALGSIRAEASVQNGLPTFVIAAEQATIAVPGMPPLTLAGAVDQESDVRATLTWQTADFAATATVRYEHDTIIAELPADALRVPGVHVHGGVTAALNLRTNEFITTGDYGVQLGNEHISVVPHNPTRALDTLSVTASWNNVLAAWQFEHPTRVHVTAPNVHLTAELGPQIALYGTVFTHTVAGEVLLSPTVQATLHTSLVPGTITATYTDALHVELHGDTPVRVTATPDGAAWALHITALGTELHGELQATTLHATLTHEFGSANIDLGTLDWTVRAHAGAANNEVALNATGNGLNGTITGSATVAGYGAALRGAITADGLTLIAETGEVLGSTVLATYRYTFGEPLARSRVNAHIQGALRGGGTITLDNGVPTLQASLISHVLPRSQVNVVGTFTNDLRVATTGSGNIRGRLLYEHGVLSGSAQLHHDIGEVQLNVVQNEVHVTGTTPYIPDGSLFAIIPLTNVPSSIALDGLGSIQGEVHVDLTEQRFMFKEVRVQQDAFAVHINQTLPFAGPYELAGDIQLPPLSEPIPVRAGLIGDELHLVASGATGEMRATVPTQGGALSALPIVFDAFALPLAGAEAIPFTGTATVHLGTTLQLELHHITAGDVALVGPNALLPDATATLAPDGVVSFLTGAYTFAATAQHGAFTVTELGSGAAITATVEQTPGGTTVELESANTDPLFQALGVPVHGGTVYATANISDEHVHASLTVSNVALGAGVLSVPELSVVLPPMRFSELLNASVELAAEVLIGPARLELLGNMFITDGVPTIDVIASTGQQVRGTVWPLNLDITSIGAVHGTARVSESGVELSELLIELDYVRVLMDGYVHLGEYPDVQLLGQVAYRDAENEYPAVIFDIHGTGGEYSATIGNDEEGIHAAITLSPSWDPSARITVTKFSAPVPELANVPISGEVLYSSNTLIGALDARIGTGLVRITGSLAITDIPFMLTGRSASTAEVIVQQVPINAVPFLPNLPRVSGAFSGTIFLRGGTLNGQLIIPELVLGSDPIYTELQIHGAHGRIDTTLHALSSSISASFENDTVRAAAHLEQFPLHEITQAIAGVRSHEIYATGYARVEYPLNNPAGAYARVATEAVSITNEDGLRGSVDISAVLENERIEVHTFDVTGLGSWRGEGVLSAEELDFSLTVDNAELDALLALVPALRPFDPGISGSFTATARGSVSSPRITFTAPDLALRVADSKYEALGTNLQITPSGVSFTSEVTGSEPLSGRLAVTGTGEVGTGLFDLTGVQLTLAGDLAIPTVGVIDDIAGTITAATGGAPLIELSGYLGNRLDVRGTLAPLDVTLTGDNVRLSLPVLMVQDTRLHPNVRVFMDGGGLTLSGSILADFLTLDPGLRAQHLQQSEETGTHNPFAGVRLAGLRLVVPQRLSFVNSLASIEGAADISLHGELQNLEVEGSATALRGSIRFSGRDFELVETAVTFNRTTGIYPHVRIVARTHIEKSRITSARSDIAFTAPLGGPTFAIDLVIAGDVTPAPLEAGGFTFDIVPQLSSDAVLEITSDNGVRTTHTFSNDELLTLAVLGRLDLASSVAGSGNLGSVLAQGVIDSALDVLIVSELERVLKAELGIDLLELRTSSLAALTSAGAEPFGVSLKVGGYLDHGLFATYQISTLDRGNYGPVLMNQFGLQYDVGPVVFDVAARVYSPNNITLFETVPEIGLSVRYDISEQLSATGAIDLSAQRFAVRFGTTFVW